MPRSRRKFLTEGSLGLMSVAISASTGCSSKPPETPGAPPAFGTSPPVGPAVSTHTFAEAEKLVRVEMTAKDIAQAAGNWQQSLASVYERRTGPRKLLLEDSLAPATVWNPTLPERVERSCQGCVLPPPGACARTPRKRGRHRLRACYLALAVDQVAADHLRASDQYLPQAAGGLRSQTALRHHLDARSRAPAGTRRGSGNRLGKVSRPAAWHSLGRKRSARHRQHSHHLRRGALSQSRAAEGCHGHERV